MKLSTKALVALAAAGGAGFLLLRRKKHSVPSLKDVEICGFVDPGYESVRDAFVGNFAKRGDVGAACAVFHKGKKVVDLWGGTRNIETGEPWEKDTMVIVHSSTKGLAAMTLAIAHSRGWLDYDAPVSDYWPEFAQNGKKNITVRQLLAHQAGLFAFDEEEVDKETVKDLDRLAEIMARQTPAWEPGTRQGYHAITLGFYESELLRRIDPQHRSLGQFFQDEIATPLGIELYLRLPETVPDSRLATLVPPSWLEMLRGFPISLTLSSLNPRSNFYRALIVNPGAGISIDKDHIYTRELEVPSGGGIGTARGIAKAYSVFATGGKELGLSSKTLEQLSAPAVPPANGFYDEVIKGEVEFSLGFMKSCDGFSFGRPGAYGAPGAGGSIGFADPDAEIGYAYITNRMGTTLAGDPRDVALRSALYSAEPLAAATPEPPAAKGAAAGIAGG